MAEQEVENKRGLGPMNNEMKPHRANYDVVRDGGLTADTYTLFEADRDMVVVVGNTDVKTAFAGGGGAGLTIGVLGGDIDAMLANTLVAVLTLDAMLGLAAAGKNLLLKKGEKIVVTPTAAALTAGKLEVVLYAHAR